MYADTPRRHHLNARRWAPDLVWLLVAEAGTIVAMVAVLRLWRARWRIPFYSDGDATLTAAWIKTVLVRGWYFDNPKLGFPTGANARDYPTGDLWHLVLLRVFALGSHNWALAMNVTFAGTFLLITATAYIALRCLGVRSITAAGGAIVTAFLPYHFAHNETHLLLSDYSVIPLVVTLAVAQLSDRPWFRLARDQPVPWSRRVAAVAIVVWAAGTGSFYYAIMSAALLAVTALFASVARRRIEPALSTLVLVAVLGIVVLAQLVPTLVNDAHHGRNHAFDRKLAGQDTYSLRPVLLFAPIDHHRISSLGSLTRKYETVSNPDEVQAVGLVAAAGLIGLLAAALAPLVGRRRLRHPNDQALALIALTGLGLGITAGGGELLALLGLTEIRDWNRISIYLGFVGIAAAAGALDRWLTRRSFPATIVAVIVVVCVTIAILDQTGGMDTPPYRSVAAEFTVERDFVQHIQRTAGKNAAILQLPYTEYPESPMIVRMPEYAQMRGWLHSDTLRWSYGAIKGRPTWQAGQLGLSVPDQLRRAKKAGFSAVWVDRRGYEDNGATIERQLRACLGPPLLVESDNEGVLYDLGNSPHC